MHPPLQRKVPEGQTVLPPAAGHLRALTSCPETWLIPFRLLNAMNDIRFRAPNFDACLFRLGTNFRHLHDPSPLRCQRPEKMPLPHRTVRLPGRDGTNAVVREPAIKVAARCRTSNRLSPAEYIITKSKFDNKDVSYLKACHKSGNFHEQSVSLSRNAGRAFRMNSSLNCIIVNGDDSGLRVGVFPIVIRSRRPLSSTVFFMFSSPTLSSYTSSPRFVGYASSNCFVDSGMATPPGGRASRAGIY